LLCCSNKNAALTNGIFITAVFTAEYPDYPVNSQPQWLMAFRATQLAHHFICYSHQQKATDKPDLTAIRGAAKKHNKYKPDQHSSNHSPFYSPVTGFYLIHGLPLSFP
jgi:hypothetical protein